MPKSNQNLAWLLLFFRRLASSRFFKLFVAILLISLACLRIYRSCNRSKTKDGQEVISNTVFISEMKAIGKIELAKISIKDVMEYELELDWALDKKVLMVFAGEVVGCIDLSQIKAEDIVSNDSLVTIIINGTEICYSKLDHSQTKLYNLSSLSEFNKIEPEMMTYLYKKGEAFLVSDSMRMVVRVQTEMNAQKILKPLLERITRKKIELKFASQILKD
jgi:Protein of unknown function (DUF4230)